MKLEDVRDLLDRLIAILAIVGFFSLCLFGMHACRTERRMKIEKGMIQLPQRGPVWVYPEQAGSVK